MQSSGYAAQEVSRLQHYAQNLRDPRARPGHPYALARALRGVMAKLGPVRVSPDATDAWESAEAEYRRLVDAEPPVHGSAKFRMHEQWYSYDAFRPHLRRALELHLPKRQRSDAAEWLAVTLRSEAWNDYAAYRAEGKLRELLEELRPL